MTEITKPVCSFFGHTNRVTETWDEFAKYAIGLTLHLERALDAGCRSFVTCLAPGVDLFYASHIAGYINRVSSAKNVDRLTPDYRDLSIRVFHPGVIVPGLFTEHVDAILRAACKVEIKQKQTRIDRYRLAVEASTHVLAVYPEGKTPYPVEYAHKCSKEVLLLTPKEVLSGKEAHNERWLHRTSKIGSII